MTVAGARLLPFRPAHLPRPVVPGANAIKTTNTVHGLIQDKNVDIVIPRDGGEDVCRADVFRPLDTEQGKKYPIIMTAGPYGKDIKYSEFYPESFAEIPEGQKSDLSAWETPEPTFWVQQGYIVVRVDEQGTGQSPGSLDTMSDQTANNFFHCIEWAASQPWSSGKVGLLGISYYAGSQWRVAARKPKGLACIIPWEGMSDYYRDRCRPGGILSDSFIQLWTSYQVNSNQYGRIPCPPPKKTWGPGRHERVACIEGILTAEQLKENRTDQPIDTAENFFLDDDYFASREYNLADIDVPMLSVANWGGIALHLRGNVLGYLGASSKNKWLWFITGRHDLPFYLPERVELQKSFLDAFLHNNDTRGWHKGPNAADGVPAVNYVVRTGAPKFNTIEGDRSFPSKETNAWPIPNTQYVPHYLSSDGTLQTSLDKVQTGTLSYRGHDGDSLLFNTKFERETEITGHPTLRLLVSVAEQEGHTPSEIDLFVTLRHLDAGGKEIFYTGTAGDPAPIVKGWLRGSVRKVDQTKSHGLWPHRNYLSTDVAPLQPETVYAVDVEIWPTSVVVPVGNTLQLEVGPKDQQGGSVFTHDHPNDRKAELLKGANILHIGPVDNTSSIETSGISITTFGLTDRDITSALVLPIIP
ncbi:alpha/beta-hydrolase [Testicularia cyperi]|uniref:Alpha/beta-hydrolase n=1 Tax=Testicularia cyperi TaxID=1882483 RepID=A0A317XG98_9BASI|nr:alpha/beta-hydrolase [Testicularia cyperi]